MKKKISSDQKKRIKASQALTFLRNHPAFPEVLGDSLFDGAWFHMAKCCKRGLSEGSRKCISLYRDEKDTWNAIRSRDMATWKRLQKRLEREYKDSGEKLEFQSIYVTYKEKYGELWQFDHMEYWYETTFFVYEGDPYNEKEYMDYKYWARYAGPEGGAETFEDALIRQASRVRRIYGSFNKDRDFLTEAEKKNNADQHMFKENMFKQLNDGTKRLSIERNPEYIEVTPALINLRWLAWFIETDYCKKQWDYHIKDFAKLIKNAKDKMPDKRRELIKKYSK